MLRKIVIPDQKTFPLQFPDEWIGKTVEVIAFEIEEPTPDPPNKTIDELKAELNGLTVNMQGFKFDRNEATDYEQ